MSEYLEIIPLDTLFFRGSTPMEAGQAKSESFFPPPVSVLQGAIWTASCIEQNKPFLVESFPFSVTGLFIKKTMHNTQNFYMAASATWFYDSSKKCSSGKEFAGLSLVLASDHTADFEKLGVKSSAKKVTFAVPKEDAKSLNGCWISTNFMSNKETVFSENDVLMPSDIFSVETRTGNAIDENRSVQKGQLYTASHIRLNAEISLIVQLDTNPLKNDCGKMTLGGEMRIAEYKKLKNLALPSFGAESGAKQFVSLLPIDATDNILSELIASQKIQILAGWDLQKQFHKPTKSYIPSGAVFAKKINESCVPLVQK